MGMSNYINFLHTINLQCSGARVSFAAPLDFDGHIEPGRLVYNDLFTIYPFENQLFTVRMTGKEIKDYLELSYDRWINTVSSRGRRGEHLLKIENAPDPRTGNEARKRNYSTDRGRKEGKKSLKLRGNRETGG